MSAGMMNKLIVAQVDKDSVSKNIVAQPPISEKGVNPHANH